MELTSGPSLISPPPPTTLACLAKMPGLDLGRFSLSLCGILISPLSLFDNLYLCFSVNNSRDGTKI